MIKNIKNFSQEMNVKFYIGRTEVFPIDDICRDKILSIGYKPTYSKKLNCIVYRLIKLRSYSKFKRDENNNIYIDEVIQSITTSSKQVDIKKNQPKLSTFINKHIEKKGNIEDIIDDKLCDISDEDIMNINEEKIKDYLNINDYQYRRFESFIKNYMNRRIGEIESTLINTNYIVEEPEYNNMQIMLYNDNKVEAEEVTEQLKKLIIITTNMMLKNIVDKT